MIYQTNPNKSQVQYDFPHFALQVCLFSFWFRFLLIDCASQALLQTTLGSVANFLTATASTVNLLLVVNKRTLTTALILFASANIADYPISNPASATLVNPVTPAQLLLNAASSSGQAARARSRVIPAITPEENLLMPEDLTEETYFTLVEHVTDTLRIQTLVNRWSAKTPNMPA